MEIGSVAIGDAPDICVATKWRLWRHLQQSEMWRAGSALGLAAVLVVSGAQRPLAVEYENAQSPCYDSQGRSQSRKVALLYFTLQQIYKALDNIHALLLFTCLWSMDI
ncbi:hypothetical protein FJT64_026074 [Amphibalanus amphitrite]|uniref:Uncharacterized protein n=1 Tax=Amphibalanus amphitrite TaxID=1232801 RepID=A0A6A4WIG7_AMPAM|nr:hypothetical protein FJT64_026074 [Amphibalanus amphitrite]